MRNTSLANKGQLKCGLTATHLSVTRGQSVLFQDLSFALTSGQILWIQGPNGIGKTTLLHVVAGLARPQKGEVVWQDINGPRHVAELIAFQGHKNSLKPRLSVAETLGFWMRLSNYQGTLDDVLSKLNLSGKNTLRTGHLSRGQQRRLALARLLVSQKPIWIMDEPLSNIDDTGRDIFKALIKVHIEQGGCALIASHKNAEKLSADTRILTLRAAPQNTARQNKQKGVT